MHDESEKDVTILQAKIGGDYKTFIKQNSKDYLERLKVELMKGFKVYFDELNTKVNEELMAQETQQKNLHEELENYHKKTDTNSILRNRRKNILLNEKIYSNDLLLKRKAFNGLFQGIMKTKEIRNRVCLIKKILDFNKKKKIFKILKKDCLFAKKDDYEIKMKKHAENEIENNQKNQKNQIDEMWNLINQAQEKLKHENRKKIQVKLMLDQMVLRGISALNLQAMNLSNNSLKDVVNCDYKKEIDQKYTQMLFPESKITLTNKFK
jgi:hypothetical protein